MGLIHDMHDVTPKIVKQLSYSETNTNKRHHHVYISAFLVDVRLLEVNKFQSTHHHSVCKV